MNCSAARLFIVMALPAALLAVSGCVERNLKIDSDPQGARVFLNDREVGVTPVKISFLWYGDYDIILRREGFKTLKTHYQVNAPWYEYPPIDLVAECLIPTTIRDEHVLPTYQLEPTPVPSIGEVVERAVQTRAQALSEEP
jgi:hypothetical protein